MNTFIRPVSCQFPISQSFGNNPAYYSQFNLTAHEGVDYACPIGTAVVACEDGVIVRRVFGDKDYGNFVVVWHQKLNLATWYCHLDSESVNIGDNVKKGQEIGKSGNTGNSTGPHLHWNVCETNVSGTRINTGNGYQGFVDGLIYLDCTTQDNGLQSQLDQCRQERDRNWNFFTAVCDALGVGANVDAAVNEAKKLIGNDDALVQKDKQLLEVTQKAIDLESQLKTLQAAHDLLVTSHDQDQKTIQTQGDQILSLQKSVQELKDTTTQPVLTGWELIKKGIIKLFGK